MLRRIVLAGGLAAYRSSLLEELGVPHAFTTRCGAAGSPFDVGELGDPASELVRDLRRIAGARSVPVADAKQVHGDGVLGDEDYAKPAATRLEADALTTEGARLVLVRTADCVPVLIALEDGSRVAAVHAGWRGLVAGVLPRALERIGARAGNAVAAVGACLSLDRFEVGPEVARAFRDADLDGVIHDDRGPRPHVDLRAAATLQLERAGVQRIDVSDHCTWNDAEDFYSYRRDVTHGGMPRTGRLAALIGPRGARADG